MREFRCGGNHDPCLCSGHYWISSILTPAAGGRSIGSNQDHDALYTLLSVDNIGSYHSIHEQSTIPVVPEQEVGVEATSVQLGGIEAASVQLADEEEACVQQVVGSAATVVEPNWDGDHDYTAQPSTIDTTITLTPAEEDLISELTSALNDLPNQSIKQMSTSNSTNSLETNGTGNQTGEISTPDIIKDFFDFGMDVVDNVTNHSVSSHESKEHIVSSHQSKDAHIKHTNNTRVPSPISKEQILDFLEDKASSPRSHFESESGYESSFSPRSLGSAEEPEDPGMELDSFIELFPSLF